MVKVDNSPAERRRGKVRGKILSAAERVFAQEGQLGLSIRRLAEEIDYSPAAIYKYFDSKETLVDELKEAFFQRLLAEMDRGADLTLPFGQRARQALATYIRVAVAKPHHYAAAFNGQSWPEGPGEDDADFGETNKGRAFLMLKGMVEEGIAIGALQSELDAGLVAKSIWAALHGLAQMIAHIPGFPALKGGYSALSQDEFIDFHADLLIRGLEKDI